MAKFDLGKVLKQAGSTAAKATEKATAAAKAGMKNLQEAAKQQTDKISEQMKADAEKKKTKEAMKQAEKKAAEEKAAIEADGVKAIAPQNAMKVFYYLMAADEKFAAEEEEQFRLIGKEIDLNFDAHQEAVVKECKEQMKKVIDSADYYDTLQDGVEDALSGEQTSLDGFITPKLLLWDLLVIANSDDEYHDAERKLIKYVVRKLNIPKDVFLEMESSLLTIRDIEREIEWIKTTDRPYLAIDKQIKELEKRREDVLCAVKALITL